MGGRQPPTPVAAAAPSVRPSPEGSPSPRRRGLAVAFAAASILSAVAIAHATDSSAPGDAAADAGGYGDFVEPVKALVEGILEDVYGDLLSVPPLRLVGATGLADNGRLTGLILLVQPRDGEMIRILDTIISVQSDRWLSHVDLHASTSGAGAMEPVRDRDGSLQAGRLDQGDLAALHVRLEASLGGVPPGATLAVTLRAPDAPPLRVGLDVPPFLASPVVELDVHPLP